MNASLDPRRIKLLVPEVVAILKAMTPAERLESGFAICERVRLRQLEHFRFLHPEWPNDRVERAVSRRMLLVSLNEPTRTIIRLLANARERGSLSQLKLVEDKLRTDGRAIERSEVEFFATFYGVLDIWEAILQRVDSAA